VANRENAQKSTGPQMRVSAVIAPLENLTDYKAFEAAVIADYDAQTAVERELVLRLASLT
jgi:hypothetical protein